MCSEPVTNYDGAISLTPRIHKPGDEGIKEAVPLKITLAPQQITTNLVSKNNNFIIL